MFYFDPSGLQLRDQIRVAGLPLIGWIVELQVVAANHQDGRLRPVSQQFGQDTQDICRRIVGAGIIAHRLAKIALNNTDHSLGIV